jgi:hypothetical protein
MKRFGMLSLVGVSLVLFFLAPLTSSAGRPSLCWLLDSPWREFLSSSGESALITICSPQFSSALTYKTVAEAQNAQVWENIRVNDPSTDVPEQTTQSETTIALYKDTVLVAFVDTGAVSARHGWCLELIRLRSV